jgi:hypothetical protein
MLVSYLCAALAADTFTFNANVSSQSGRAQLLYFRSVGWLTSEHKNYCFRLINLSSTRGETVTVTREQIHKWLVSGAPPERAKSYLECTMVGQLTGLESIQTDNAFRELRATILKRGESLGINPGHIQEWISSGNIPKSMKSRLQSELVCSVGAFNAVFRELRKEIMRGADRQSFGLLNHAEKTIA